MLRSVADVGRVDQYERRNAKGELIPTCRISLWVTDEKDAKGKNKVKKIIGWQMASNSSYVDNLGIAHVKQEIELFFSDNTKTDAIPYADFGRNKERMEAEIIKKAEDENGQITLTIKCSDGETFDIGKQFINQ